MFQSCPLCKKDVPFADRFPYYLCGDCKSLLTDREGTSIEYYFAANPFGYKGQYKNDPGRAYLYDLCYIGAEEFRVFSDGKNECYIQPVNYSKYATRVGRINELPSDPMQQVYSGKKKPDSKSKLKIFLFLIFALLPVIVFVFLKLLMYTRLLNLKIALCLFILVNFLTLLTAAQLKLFQWGSVKKYFTDIHLFLFLFLGFFIVGFLAFWFHL